MAQRLLKDPLRPGLNIAEPCLNNFSRPLFVDGSEDELLRMQDKIVKQLKIIKTHMEVQTGEVLELPLNDDDSAGAQ